MARRAEQGAGRAVADYQPIKLAAFEGLYRTQSGAPLHLGGVYLDDEVRYGIPLPYLLSLLAEHDRDERSLAHPPYRRSSRWLDIWRTSSRTAGPKVRSTVRR